MNNKLYELKEKLCKELEEYSAKDLSPQSLEVVDKLCHAIKNLDKIIEKHEEKEYSNSYGMYNDVSYGRGRNTRRDYMGRYSTGYSRDDNMIMELTELMDDAPDERTRMEFQKFINKMKMM